MITTNERFDYFLNTRQKFTIPLYQRRYSWERKQCKQLLEDIIKVGQSDDPSAQHFIGSIVLSQTDGFIPTYIIIDGQQRITTLNLLIAALAKYLFENNQNIGIYSSQQLLNYYLVNDAQSDLYYMLELTEDDDKTFKKIVDNVLSSDKLDFDKNDSENLIKNYNFFKKNINEENIEDIVKGFTRLLIVKIIVTEKENPQLIFESLNATGLKLNQSDLIRNYILMILPYEKQEELYKKYWYHIEKGFENKQGDNSNSAFDLFIRDYLTIENGAYPKLSDDDIYIQFKKHSQGFDTESLIKKIFIDSKYYLNAIFNLEEDKNLNESFESLNKMDYKVTRPFILALYRDYKKDLLKKEEFIEILHLTETYLIRRSICGFASASLNKIFARLYADIIKIKEEKDLSYVDSYKIALLLKKGNSRMPNDEDFKNNFVKYDKSRHRMYIFDKLENYGFKETIDLTGFTVEHIMPQTLSDEWKEYLGIDNYEIIHMKYLEVLGNITFTRYNSNMSNASFDLKKKIGYIPSNLRLNRDLCEFDYWDEESIIKRSENLAEKAKLIWEYPTVSEKVWKKYGQTKLEQSDFETPESS